MNLTTDETPQSWGLCLSGGGGKGAYEIGVLRALSEHDVHFTAIAGTSVGGLNAVLAADGDLLRAQEVWESLGRRDVFRFRAMSLPNLVLRLSLVLLGAGRDTWRAQPRRLLSQVTRNTIAWFGVGVVFSLIQAAPLKVEFSSRFLLALALGLTLATLAFVWSLPKLIWTLVDKMNLFALDNEPLRATVERLVRGRSRASWPRVCVTIGAVKDVFSGCWPSFEETPSWFYWRRIRRPVPTRRFLPNYEWLNGPDNEKIIDNLLRTSALPFGIFPRPALAAVGWLDGGLADNTPIWPLLEAGCDGLVVVLLEPLAADRDAWKWLKNKLVGERRLVLDQEATPREFAEFLQLYGPEVPNSRWPSHHELMRTFRDAHWREDRAIAEVEEALSGLRRFLVVAPSRSLGGVLTGTLRFSPVYAGKLMDLGYVDASAVLARN